MTERKKAFFLGASITQGKISKSFENILKKNLGTSNYNYINYGIAGYESFNVLKQINKVLSKNPDFVVLLVGTNDVLSGLDPKLAKLTRKLKHIPHEPTLANYCKNITSIIRQLKQNSGLKIAIASLPVVGENLNSIENKTIREYNLELKKIAENENVDYLPVFEQQSDYLLKEINGKGKDYLKGSNMAYKALFMHFLLFKSFDSISQKNGYLLLTDGIHQNSKGASFIANAIESFIRANIG
ncbi:MAG: hypothetical protein JXA77_11235 [Bacteroidales bacterium]|nr:hypothetical protein [Bacteroidales bacterium]MBN2819066.1 hypothetical protein [Bacteroidales bacterium]